jgi:hypothetical protein
MFYPVPNGSVYEIPDNCFGFIYKCNVPPQGYGVSTIDGRLAKTEVFERHEIDEENVWVRPKVESYYQRRRETEKEYQKKDPKYVDEVCQKIRQREWKRRILGIWFHNYNPKKKIVELVYITGANYFYITYWKFQGKYMDFRIPDMEWWYVARYIETDPCALGGNELTKRKNGKTARVGCWLYERMSKPPKAKHGGLQSKSDLDAADVMKKAIVQPWQKLPDFFRPIYDTLKGDAPPELIFSHTSRKGASTNEVRSEEDALDNWIDYRSSDTSAYDGPELYAYVADEAGKTKKPTSIKDRQQVVRYCSEIDYVMTGKHWYTTTVELDDDEVEDDEFFKMTQMSNPLVRDDNGFTLTGLYTIFLPAHKGMNFDRYGFPDEDRSLKLILNTVQKYIDEGLTREAASFKRKNPINIKWAFAIDAKDSLYDPELIQTQIDKCSWGEGFTEYGDLVWVDGKEFWIEKRDANGNILKDEQGTDILIPNSLYWVPNVKGEFEKVKGWLPAKQNDVYEKNGNIFPNQSYAYRGGADPFRYDKTKDKRRSNAAGFIYQMDDISQNQEFNDTFVLRYCKRPNSTRLANIAMLKMSWWCGCQMLFERNVNHWKEHFNQWKCNGFLMWMPNEVEPGVYTGGSGAGSLIQTLCNYTEAEINKNSSKVYFITLLTDWLKFKVDDTQKFDEAMAAGIALIAVKGKKYKLPNQQSRNIEDILPYRKAS